jgi:hypothetical protein
MRAQKDPVASRPRASAASRSASAQALDALRWVALAAVVLFGGLAGAGPANAAASVALGRWEGQGTNGGRIAFVVGYERGKLTFADPTVTCGLPENKSLGFQEQTTHFFDQDWSPSPNSGASQLTRTRIGARGSFALTTPTPAKKGVALRWKIKGRLRGSRGVIRSDVGELRKGCSFANVQVRQIAGQVRADGIYTVSGSRKYTTGTIEVYSGGAVLLFRSTFGGPPEPQVLEVFGPDRAELVCSTNMPGGGGYPLGSDGLIRLTATTSNLAVPLQHAEIVGGWAGNTAFGGAYTFVYRPPGAKCAPLVGTFAAVRTTAIGPALSFKARTPKTGTDGGRRCRLTPGVVDVGLSGTKYPEIIKHMEDAIAAGWPRTLVLNRAGADRRRRKAVRQLPVQSGVDRDEYPPAVLRGRGPKSLRQGTKPTGWKASVRYVNPAQNQGAGASIGAKLRPYCSGQRVTISAY